MIDVIAHIENEGDRDILITSGRLRCSKYLGGSDKWLTVDCYTFGLVNAGSKTD